MVQIICQNFDPSNEGQIKINDFLSDINLFYSFQFSKQKTLDKRTTIHEFIQNENELENKLNQNSLPKNSEIERDESTSSKGSQKKNSVEEKTVNTGYIKGLGEKINKYERIKKLNNDTDIENITEQFQISKARWRWASFFFMS